MRLLSPADRQKLDPSDDDLFYAYPRLVTHVDDGFIAQLTNLFRERLQPGGRILDLMSSWVSHLPAEMEFTWVEGQGMNPEELAANPRLNRYFLQNLNKSPQLPLADNDFDAVLITVSIQYLEYPEAVMAEIHRVLKPGGQVIISFSNRMFYQKAIARWRDSSDLGRLQLVKTYLQSAAFEEIETIVRPSSLGALWQRLGFLGDDPFYAVLARKGQ